MTEHRKWIDGYFDDTLSAEQLAALAEWIKSDPEHAVQFANASLLHDRLRNALTTDHEDTSFASAKHNMRDGYERTPISVLVWRTAASLTALAAGLALLWFNLATPSASAAIRELDRIITSSIRSKDRTYQIVVEAVTHLENREKRSDRPESQRPTKPPLDGATLHVRSGNQFVLIRKTNEGIPFITGSDGSRSWAINVRGPVRVSSDIHHFDRDLPGHESSIPLANLHEGLEKLKRAYQLHFSTLGPEEYETLSGESIRLLVAVKKPKERGPQRVEIVYDSISGRILSMRFIQMPYGPDRLDLRLSLVNENELPVDFFDHVSHHSPDRTVETEK